MSEDQEKTKPVYVWVEPRNCGTMYISKVLSLTDCSMTFDGSFYDAMNGIMFPECVIHRNDTKQFFHVELTSYKQHEDTSEYWTDDEEGRICLFPSHVITVTWRILKEIQPSEELSLVREIIQRRKAFREAWFEAERNRPETPPSDDDSVIAHNENNEHK
jgi:hypothetical protein